MRERSTNSMGEAASVVAGLGAVLMGVLFLLAVL